MDILTHITTLPEEIELLIDKRLSEFAAFESRSEEAWFSELCYCILTANAKAKTALALEKTLAPGGFIKLSEIELVKQIREHKHRFHNTKASRIVQARAFINIKELVRKSVREKGERLTRDWLADTIVGLGYKEASHFLRNVGYTDCAILDRHIINLMVEHELIEKPKTLTKKTYLEVENTFRDLSRKLNMSSARLDLVMWYIKTGEVLK